MYQRLLHENALLQLPVSGRYIRRNFARRVDEVAGATENLEDPSISVVIRSRNNAQLLKGLLEDIARQEFEGKVELVVVDTESTDGTIKIARDFNAIVVPITQADFSYPKALNLGFSAAKHDWVFSLVDHSRLAHTQFFKVATRAQSLAGVAAVSGTNFPKPHTTRTERFAGAVIFPRLVRKPAHLETKGSMGFLPANASVLNRAAWAKVGGFDERYAAGGEDVAIAKSLLGAGYKILSDPAMIVYHSHGVGPISGLQQYYYWLTLNKPRPFVRNRLESYRPDFK